MVAHRPHSACGFAVLVVAWAAACGDGATRPDSPNREPQAVGTIAERTVAIGETVSVDVSAYFSDPDGDTLSYEASSSNAGVAGVSVSGGAVTVAALAKGIVVVTVTARDPDGLIAQQRFQVMVPNRAPAVIGAVPAQAVFVGETATVDVSPYFSDADGDALSYAATSSNAGVAAASVAGSSVLVSGLASGSAAIVVTATDPQGLATAQRFDVTVPNRRPEVVDAIPAQTVFIGETVTVDVSAYFRDADGDALSYAAASSNAGVAAASAAGSSVLVSGLARGSATVVVLATDPQGLGAEQRFEVTVPNRAPEPLGEIPARTALVGETVTIDVSAYFRDPDGDPLSYAAASSNARVVAASATASSVAVVPLAAGVATVTVTATDPGGLSAMSPFGVTVQTSAPGSFHIELVFATSVTARHEAAFRAAAERWMAVLAPTDLPDVPANRTLSCGDDPRFQRSVGTVDDVIAVIAVTEIDGPGGVLGRAGPCWLRANSMPFYGRIELDGADLDRLDETGDLEELVVHEMGHVLGIGTVWGRLGLLRDPASDGRAPDTHFTGRRAIAAFDEAGGTGYTGAKVPVENTGSAGSRNGHWRESVLTTELMTSFLRPGLREPLSAITIQSLADLGYEVDATLAEAYRLPGAAAARALETAPRIPYGDDIWRGPMVFVDAEGRIVRVIPGRIP